MNPQGRSKAERPAARLPPRPGVRALDRPHPLRRLPPALVTPPAALPVVPAAATPPHGLRVAPDAVRRIVVFRALMLGDLLCAIPALRALRAAYPAAAISLVGLPWAESFAHRLPHIDEFIAFPGFPGLADTAADVQALPGFLAKVQARRFDLALQLHGSGWLSNCIVAAFGARHTATFCGAEQDFCPEPPLRCPYPTRGHEIERLLALTDTLGVARRGLDLEFPLVRRDEQTVQDMLDPVTWRRFVIVHPGAQLASRRWPVERFAAVADALMHDGWRVVVTGTAAELALARTLTAGRSRAFNLAGRTTLWQLGALVRQAQLVIANDTGISHVAAALGTRSVIVSSGADVERWAPLARERHRVLWRDVPCRPCQHTTCPTGHGCGTAIEPAEVLALARAQLRAAAPAA